MSVITLGLGRMERSSSVQPGWSTINNNLSTFTVGLTFQGFKGVGCWWLKGLRDSILGGRLWWLNASQKQLVRTHGTGCEKSNSRTVKFLRTVNKSTSQKIHIVRKRQKLFTCYEKSLTKSVDKRGQ